MISGFRRNNSQFTPQNLVTACFPFPKELNSLSLQEHQWISKTEEEALWTQSEGAFTHSRADSWSFFGVACLGPRSMCLFRGCPRFQQNTFVFRHCLHGLGGGFLLQVLWILCQGSAPITVIRNAFFLLEDEMTKPSLCGLKKVYFLQEIKPF